MNLNNLVICVTPFQMLLANRLISQIGEPCDILLISYIDSIKYRYYFNNLKRNSLVRHSFFFHLHKYKIKSYFSLRILFKEKYYDKIIFASINDFFIHSILNFIKGFNEINTFDDGTANIFKGSFYYSRNRESFLRKIFDLLFSSWDMDKVKMNSKVHYTIYSNISNIIDNTHAIKLFENVPYIGKDDNVEYIFLGQPFDSFDLSPKIFIKMKSSFSAIKYYLHPREDINNLILYGISKKDFITSELLVEDYIYNLISLGTRVHVYSISSSAAFNIAFWKNVSVHLIKTNTTYSLFKELYEIANDLEIDILNIDE